MGGTTHTLRPKSYQTSSSVPRAYILSIRISTPNIFRQSFSKLNRSLTCQCFVAVLDELRPKAGFKHFEAIFVGYEEARVGWHVRDLKGIFFFSRDVIVRATESWT